MITNEQTIVALIHEYQSLNLTAFIDYDKFNQYAIVHHSATIEGSTLTDTETRLLLDEGVTPKGKPLLHSLMVKDHYDALRYTLDEAEKKSSVTTQLIQQINAVVMKNTGSVYQTVFGEIDSAKGLFRKGNVSAGSSYFVNFDKVPKLVDQLSQKITESMSTSLTEIEQFNLSFDAHFDFLTIHPFYDGNGRTSRLLMNLIQRYFQLPLAIVFKEDKAAYYEALVKTRKQEEIAIFREFMYQQLEKLLTEEILKYKKMNTKNSGSGFSMVF